ncbi:MAG: hypothetical protein ACETWB_00195 [Anaerolineae bacterium]
MALHDLVVGHAEELLRLHKERAKTPEGTDAYSELTCVIKREDSALDALVCELYELAEEEIAIVEQ